MPRRLRALAEGPARALLDTAAGQRARQARDLLNRRKARSVRLVDYAPVPKLVLPSTRIERAASPVIDAHNHLGRWLSRGRWMAPDVGALVAVMDELNVAAMVNLDGRWGDDLEANLERLDRAHPGRFATFCHIDWSGAADAGFTAAAVDGLERAARQGAKGVKVWKDLGRSVRGSDGALLLHDDPRLAPVWDVAGALGLPVLVHVGDPLAFFDPADTANERLEELMRHPSASWAGNEIHHRPLLDRFEAAVAAHPGTRFVAAHVGNLAEDLDYVEALLGRHTNVSIDLSGRMAELGRQPRRARRLIVAHPDRVVFGTDTFPVVAEELRTWFRFLETDDEHFAYSTQPIPPQGRWAVSALDLPPDVLAAVYAGNARALLPSLRASTAR